MGHLVHGLQEGGNFSGYYGDYCYLPLYIVVEMWCCGHNCAPVTTVATKGGARA